jgi:hypothetical protein
MSSTTAVVEHAGQRVLQGQALDPALHCLHRPAQRVERGGQDAHRVAAAPPQRRSRVTCGEPDAGVREPLDGSDDEPAGDQADADHEQERRAHAGQQDLAAAGGERLGPFDLGEAQLQDRQRLPLAIDQGVCQHGDIVRDAVVRMHRAPGGCGVDGDASEIRMHAAQARQAGADPRHVAHVAGGEGTREAARHGDRLGLAGPPVRVADRRDRPVREKSAAGQHQGGDAADQPRLQSRARHTVAG